MRVLFIAFASSFYRRSIHNCAHQSLIFDFHDFLLTIYRAFTPPFLHIFMGCWCVYFALLFLFLSLILFCFLLSICFICFSFPFSRTLAFVCFCSHLISSFVFIPNSSRFCTIELVILEMFVCTMQKKVSEYLAFCIPWIQSTFINE